MLSSFLFTTLKPTETTSPNKPFDYDCVMLYLHNTYHNLDPGFK